MINIMLLTFDKKKSMPTQCYEFIANHFRTTFVLVSISNCKRSSFNGYETRRWSRL